MHKKIAFIGVGNMATALINGITSNNKCNFDWSDIILFDKNNEKTNKYQSFSPIIANSIKDAVCNADYIFLCVKPQNFPEVLSVISTCDDIDHKVFITIAAGIPIKMITDATNNAPVIRVMPNTPMLIGKGMIALCRGDNVHNRDFDAICEIFQSTGDTVVINENEMNRIISVTGSSPAYVFLFIKAMLAGAAEQGLINVNCNASLSEKEVIDCICNTIIGAAELMKSGTLSPDEQIAIVSSKGGTTERAVSELINNHFCESIISAMKKCTERADELGNNK